MSLKELPVTHFKVAVEELNHRYKVCLALASLVEEIVELGSSTGKSLSKMGGQAFLSGQSQWFPTSSVALESIFKMTTATTGKQLVGFSSNLNQNISKPFPEQVKVGKRKVAGISARIVSMVDEYRKAKNAFTKNLEKYHRLVSDTETAIKARYAAATELADGRSNSIDKEAPAAQPATGDNFMNRSLNKMLSKIAPEKKLDERCRDLVREVDVAEKTLIGSSKRLVVQRSDVLGEITKAMVELEELETIRLAFMKEGLSRFCLASDLIANQQYEAISLVLERTGNLDANAEAVHLMTEVNRPSHLSSPGMKKRVDSTSSDSDEEVDMESELMSLFATAEKLGEAMEFFRNMVTRTANSLMEVAENEESYSRSVHKLLDRHGYTRNTAAQWVYAADYSAIPMLAEPVPVKSAPLSAAIGAVGATTLALAGGLRSAEYLSRFESPLTKAGWELVISCFGNTSDLQMRSSEVAGEEVCQQLELVTQRLDIGRKELIEKLNSNRKMVENAKLEVKRVAAKLSKCSSLLKERRVTVKQVKDVILSDSGDTVSDVSAAQDCQLRESVGSLEPPSALSATLDETVTPSAAPADPGSAVLSRKTSLFRKGGLKQVVGLETQADRVSRIEKQVATLEEEERELAASLVVAEKALVQVTTVAKTEVLPVFDATKEFLSTDLVTIKNAIECLTSFKTDAIASSRNFNRHVKGAHDEIEISKDVADFVRAIQTAVDGIPKDQLAQAALIGASNTAAVVSAMGGGPLTLLDIPELEAFTPTSSELITQQRVVIASQQPAPSVYSISNLAMAAYSSGGGGGGGGGGGNASDEGSPTPSGGGYFNRIRRNTEDGGAGSTTALCPDTPSTVDDDSESLKSIAAPPSDRSASPLGLVSGDSSTQELSKFGLTSNDKVIESYSCALYPKKGMLVHGRLFITQHYAAFSGWPDTRVLLLLRDIHEVVRTNTLYYVPNALSIVMKDNSEYFLGSFIDREQCYANLVSLSDVGKHMASLPGYDESAETRKLEFGYQTRNNFFGGGGGGVEDAEVSVAVNGNGKGIASADGAEPEGDSPGALQRSTASPIPVTRTNTPPKPASVPASAELATPPRHPKNEFTTPVSMKQQQQQQQQQAKSMKETTAPTPPASSPPSNKPALSTTSATSPVPEPVPVLVPPSTPVAPVPIKPIITTSLHTPTSAVPTAAPAPATAPIAELPAIDFDDGINISTMFDRSNISLMQEKVFSFSSTKLWKTCWLQGKGYGGFLLEEGEIDVNYTEWVPLASGSVPEDVAKLPYCCSRQFNYSHVRTTMLMFGPKNAPTHQTQYLYLPGARKVDPLDSAALAKMRPARGVIMTLTSFQGIPMCDVFKVLQYWSFERSAEDHSRTDMRVGLAIHYMKSSMFKGQIYSGSKEELTVQSLKWLAYAEKCSHALPTEIAAAFVEEVVDHLEGEERRDAMQRRRSSLKKINDLPESPSAAAVAAAVAASSSTSATSMSAVNQATENRVDQTTVNLTSETYVQVNKTEVRNEHVNVQAGTNAAPAALEIAGGNQVILILGCAVLVLLVLLSRESAHNQALVQQVNLLSRKIEMSQTAMEISLRQSQAVLGKMEALIGKTIQK